MYKENGRFAKSETSSEDTHRGKILNCTNCNQSYYVERLEFGELVKCPGCKQYIEDIK